MRNKTVKFIQEKKNKCFGCLNRSKRESAYIQSVSKTRSQIELQEIKGELVPIPQSYIYDIGTHTQSELIAKNNEKKIQNFIDPQQQVQSDLENELVSRDGAKRTACCPIHPKNKLKITWDIYVTM